MIGLDPVLSSPQCIDPFNLEHIAADSLNFRSHQVEKMTKALDMGLACRVVNRSLTHCSNGSHQGIFRRHDTRLFKL